ncbi:MAG TPA: hypothetical protein VMV93_04150 [Chloroflexota bacterium]|nr:hypothetical protein [Chloroflexota bacterium]
MAALYVLSSSGDQRVTWQRERLEVRDPEALSAIAEAEALFTRERARGSSAFKVLPGQPAQRLDVFDATAEEIVIVPRMAGGA